VGCGSEESEKRAAYGVGSRGGHVTSTAEVLAYLREVLNATFSIWVGRDRELTAIRY
jgi:hypothetical protein